MPDSAKKSAKKATGKKTPVIIDVDPKKGDDPATKKGSEKKKRSSATRLIKIVALVALLVLVAVLAIGAWTNYVWPRVSAAFSTDKVEEVIPANQVKPVDVSLAEEDVDARVDAKLDKAILGIEEKLAALGTQIESLKKPVEGLDKDRVQNMIQAELSGYTELGDDVAALAAENAELREKLDNQPPPAPAPTNRADVVEEYNPTVSIDNPMIISTEKRSAQAGSYYLLKMKGGIYLTVDEGDIRSGKIGQSTFNKIKFDCARPSGKLLAMTTRPEGMRLKPGRVAVVIVP
jgi:hypothetical protein